PPFPFAPLVTWLSETDTGLNSTQIAPLKMVEQVSPTPLFLIHGGQDDLIPAESSRALYQAAGDPKELWIVNGAEHVGAESQAEAEYQDWVVSFFERYLTAR